jgi:hypothetical protein
MAKSRIQLGLADIGRGRDDPVLDALTHERANPQQGDHERSAQHRDVRAARADHFSF